MMIDTDDLECFGVDADRRYGPASDRFAGHEYLFGSFEVSSGKPIDHREDPSTELRRREWISLYEVPDNRSEVLFCLGGMDRHRRSIASIV